MGVFGSVGSSFFCFTFVRAGSCQDSEPKLRGRCRQLAFVGLQFVDVAPRSSFPATAPTTAKATTGTSVRRVFRCCRVAGGIQTISDICCNDHISIHAATWYERLRERQLSSILFHFFQQKSSARFHAKTRTSSKLTYPYPTNGKGNSSSQLPMMGIC